MTATYVVLEDQVLRLRQLLRQLQSELRAQPLRPRRSEGMLAAHCCVVE